MTKEHDFQSFQSPNKRRDSKNRFDITLLYPTSFILFHFSSLLSPSRIFVDFCFFWVIVISTRARHLKRIIICHKSIIIRFQAIIKTASDENKIHRKGENTERTKNKTAIRLMITTRWRLSPVVEFNTQGETSTHRVILYSS